MSSPINDPSAPKRGRWNRRSRTVAVACTAGVIAVGLAVGGAAIANADTTHPVASSTTAPAGPAGHGHRFGGMHTPHIGGTVTAVDGTTVTVKDFEGFTRTITLESGVTVKKDGAASTTAAITKGAHIEARGTVDSNGTTLDATAVEIGMPTRPAGGPGWKGHGPAGTAPGTAPSERPSPAPVS